MVSWVSSVTDIWYCKTLNVHVFFISWISWSKQNCEIKGCKYMFNVY